MTNHIVLALGTSLGDRKKNLIDASKFIESITQPILLKSSIWETDPVGAAKNIFFNSVVSASYSGTADELITSIKDFELEYGRDMSAPKWSDRLIDIDIITFGQKYSIGSNLEIPHPQYKNRLFVLKPLQEIFPNWMDPLSGDHIDELIFKAAPLHLSKKSLKW
ncbi:MAG TPA: 2-amino-4-hydroxy-6-hydroxymethyldihydropteridine diphosphokinase [Bacteroidetes bacterium]|nr:2-amino-4-hydroxy-6-hydroxymethyldihydropteridine diphosphokinase [Bacteroidota bacterium]